MDNVAYWAKKDNSLPFASLCTLFSESKKSPTRIKGKRFSPLKRRSESEVTFVVGVFLTILGGNGLSTSTCNPILTLFYGEKLKDVLRLAYFCLFGAETDYPLPCATLFTNFSTAKKLHSKERKQKPFAAQTPQQKRGYVENFAHRNKQRLRNLKNAHFTLSLKLCRKIAARQARGWGWYLNIVLIDSVQLLCHVTLWSA